MGGTLNWLPSLKNVPCINGLSQRWQYVKILSGGGDGGGGIPGGGGKFKLGTKVKNPNWDPRFKPTTALDAKIKKMTMKKIMEKANFDESTCVPCNKAGNERCLTYHAKGLCQTGCRHAADHKQLPNAAVVEMHTSISDDAAEVSAGGNCNIRRLSLCLCYLLQLLACPQSFHNIQCQFNLILVVKANYVLPIQI